MFTVQYSLLSPCDESTVYTGLHTVHDSYVVTALALLFLSRFSLNSVSVFGGMHVSALTSWLRSVWHFLQKPCRHSSVVNLGPVFTKLLTSAGDRSTLTEVAFQLPGSLWQFLLKPCCEGICIIYSTMPSKKWHGACSNRMRGSPELFQMTMMISATSLLVSRQSWCIVCWSSSKYSGVCLWRVVLTSRHPPVTFCPYRNMTATQNTSPGSLLHCHRAADSFQKSPLPNSRVCQKIWCFLSAEVWGPHWNHKRAHARGHKNVCNTCPCWQCNVTRHTDSWKLLLVPGACAGTSHTMLYTFLSDC